MPTTVVYVHGLWLGGAESLGLRRYLARALPCQMRIFRYSPMSAGIDSHAQALGSFLSGITAPTLHLVGHSLGGVVILRSFELGLVPPAPGRVVLLGAPARGSLAAQRFARLPFGRALLGPAAREALLGPRERPWRGDRDLGIIAGNRPVGLGRLLGAWPAPSDGTVLVAETRVEGARAALELPVGHTGFLFSRSVARQTAAFLREGRFES